MDIVLLINILFYVIIFLTGVASGLAISALVVKHYEG